MTWFRIDDKFAEHPKVRRLAKDRVSATGLWTLCGVWCADNLSDGFVPAEVVRRYDPRLRMAKRLVEVTLWHEVAREGELGYEFHEWSEHQPTRSEVVEKRRKTAAKVKAWRDKKAAQAAEEFPPEPEDEESCNPVTSGVTNQVSNPAPDPTRPDLSTSPDGEVLPSLRSGGARKRTAPAKRATRIPEDFAADAEMVEWARANTPNVGRAETDLFVDYWKQATKNAEKRDWRSAWQVWMRKEQKRIDEQGTRRVGAPATGSRRTDKALSALAPDDPFLAQYAAAAQHAKTGQTDLLVIEGGRSA